jgi:integrase
MVQNIKISLHDYNLEADLAKIKEWSIPSSEKKNLVAFIREFISGRVTGRKPNVATAKSILAMLRTSMEYLNKEGASLTQEDIIKYSDELAEDKVKKNIQGKHEKGDKPYKEAVKLRIKYSLAVYLKWLLKEKSASFVQILKIKPQIKRASVDFLTEEEIIKLLDHCKNDEEKFLVGILFDSGLRAEEFYNIRKEDIEAPKDRGYYRINIKTEYSKTQGRIISLTWYKSYDLVKNYLQLRTQQGIRPGEPVFNMKYRTAREFLYRLGLRVLGRKIYFHLFRHSSATYYASKINRQQLCIRYGWAFSSDMPDTYISRSGVEMKDVEDKFDNLERINLREENNKLKTEIAIIKENSESGRTEMENLKKKQEEQQKELEKMDMFFVRAMENPKMVVKLKNIIEKKIKEEMLESKIPRIKV